MTRATRSLFDLMLAAVRRQARRFVVLAFVAVLAMAATVTGLTISSFSTASADSATGDSSILTRISIFNDASAIPFSALDDVRAIKGVSAVTPVIRVLVGLNESKSSVILVSAGSKLDAPIVEGKVPESGLSGNEIVLPEKANGVDLRPYLGKAVSIEYTIGVTADSGVAKNMPLTVVALFDPSYQVDGPVAGYVPLSLAESLAAQRAGVSTGTFEASMGLTRIDVTAASVAQVPAVTAALQAKGYHAISEIQRVQQVPGVIELLRGATIVLFVVLLVLAVGTAALIANSIATERVREIAVLRACGLSHSRVLGVLLGEALAVVVSACLFGAAIGTLLAVTAGQTLRESLGGGSLGEMSVPWLQVVVFGVILITLIAAAYAAAIVRTTRRPIASVLQGAS